MRMASLPPSPSVKERKVSQSASCKIDNIIRQLFLPMLGMPTPDKTSFQSDDDTQVIRQVAEECPAALASEADFVEYMVVLYRKFQTHGDGRNYKVRFNAGGDSIDSIDSIDTDDSINKNTDNNIDSNINSETNSDSCQSTQQRSDAQLPLAGQAMVALQLPMQVFEDGADLPKALAHAVCAAPCVGELHHLGAGL
jgi:hypothetical protein